ncbi:zinc finger protein 431-like [Hetaerina americana]|uniref:zinc finger protein 431-like n=1 Tax=Hetaerina americana TaxID=62018 RepID=UPI003A7F50DE
MTAGLKKVDHIMDNYEEDSLQEIIVKTEGMDAEEQETNEIQASQGDVDHNVKNLRKLKFHSTGCSFSVLDDRVRSLAVAVADKKRAVINHKLLRLTSVSQESSVSDPSPQIHCEHQFATRVVNLSKCEISPDALSLLNKGLKFAPAIPISSKGYKNLATDCEVALSNQPRGIKHLVADTIITDIKNHSIPARRSSEGEILKSLRDLKAENQLVLSKADKGNCTVILDRDDYTSFVKKQHLMRHILTHTEEKPHRCEMCSRAFTQNSNLKRHMLTHTGEGSHRCEICSRAFAHNIGLKRHLLTHTGEKSHKCKICSRAFALNANLRRHLLTHTGEKPHQFPQDNIWYLAKNQAAQVTSKGGPERCVIEKNQYPGFSRNLKVERESNDASNDNDGGIANLQVITRASSILQERHISSLNNVQITVKREISDNDDQETVDMTARLKKVDHIMDNHEEDSHQEMDGIISEQLKTQGFVQKMYLKRHMLTHTEEKPHRCKVCSRAFTRKGNLKMHLLAHTGEKPYQCMICSKGFTQKGDLKRHFFTHTGEKRYMSTHMVKTSLLSSGGVIHVAGLAEHSATNIFSSAILGAGGVTGLAD